jgi:hypothetical protein
MNVRPAILWALVMGSALAGALAGTLFEGVLDKYLMLPAILGRFGLAQVEEVVSTAIGALLATAIVGLLAFTAYTWFSHKRR